MQLGDFSVLTGGIEAVLIDNKDLQFHTSIFKGDLDPEGSYYVTDQAVGQIIIDECKASLAVNASGGKANNVQLVEVRGRVSDGAKNFSHPIAFYDGQGNLNRLFGRSNVGKR